MLAPVLALLILAMACGDEDATSTPVVIEKEVIKEVEVVKEVPVEKEVIKEVEVVKEVVVTVVATPTPRPTGVQAKVALLEVMMDPVIVETNLIWAAPPSSANNQTRHFMDPLVAMDPFTGEQVPGLATEWEMITPDAKTWRVKLRKGIPFHDGWGEFTARDVPHTYALMTQADCLNTDCKTWRQLLGETVDVVPGVMELESEVFDRVKVIDDYTVEFNLLISRVDLENVFSSRGGSTFMNSKAQWDAEGLEGYERKPVGTGSWEYVTREIGRSLQLERVEDHYRKTPDFKGLRIHYVREAAGRLAALLAGEAHMSTMPRSLYAQATSRGMVVLQSTIPANQVVMGMGGFFLPTKPTYDPDIPFFDIRVREAINRAINRKEIREQLFLGAGEPLIVNAFHQNLEAWNPEWEKNFERDYGYDVEKAKALLAEAGYPDGFKIKAVRTELAQLPEMGELGEVVALYLKDIGLDATIEELEFSALKDRYRSGNTHLLVWALPQPMKTPIAGVRTFNLSHESGGSVAFSETEFLEERYPKYLQSVDPVERGRLLREIGDYTYEQYLNIPIIWLLGEIVADPDIVADYHFSGGIAGTYTHMAFIDAVPR
jgi:ABC-type transport system substrate-binding protein